MRITVTVTHTEQRHFWRTIGKGCRRLWNAWLDASYTCGDLAAAIREHYRR